MAAAALGFSHMARFARPAIINGAAGIAVLPPGRPYALLSFAISAGRIVEIDVLGDPTGLARLDLDASTRAGQSETKVQESAPGQD